MHCTALHCWIPWLLVKFGHECPVMFDPAGFPGTLGQPVDCRDAMRGKTAKTAVLSEFWKLECGSDGMDGCLAHLKSTVAAVTMTDNESIFLTKVFLLCCKSRNCNGILLPKLFWPTVKKNVLVIKKNIWNSRLRARIWKKIVTCSWRFLLSNKLEQLEFWL